MNPLVTTVAAPLNVSAQRRGPALNDGTQYLTLLAGQHATILCEEVRFPVSEHISDFQTACHQRFSFGLVEIA